jgi:anti-repressor protein
MQEVLSPFNYNSNQVRAIAIEGEPWFCANDVCEILGYTNANKVVKDHCKPKGVTNRYPLQTEGGLQYPTFISEGNLYRLVIRSKKEEAQPFETWVFDEVIPAIRKTGKYAGPPVPPPLEYQRRLEKLEAEVLPKALAFDRLDTMPGTLCIADAAKVLGIPQATLFAEMAKRRWIFKRSAHGKWLPYADKAKRGFLALCIDTVFDEEADEKEYPQTRVTTKGLARLAYLLTPRQ